MKTKKKRYCSVCNSTEHRADHHGKKADRATRILNQAPILELEGDDALRTLIMPDYAVYIVMTDQIGQAISGAVNGYEKAGEGQRGMSMVSAFSKLAERAAKIDRKVLTNARSAWQQLQLAQEAYAKAVEPIKAAIIPSKKG